MSYFRMQVKSIKIVQAADTTDFTTAAAFAAGTDLGDLKGTPFAKVNIDPKTVDTQAGKKTLGKTAKVEVNVVMPVDETLQTTLLGFEGKNVALLCTPKGAVSADNPYLVIKNFPLQHGTEVLVGDASTVKLMGEVPVYDETDIIDRLAALV